MMDCREVRRFIHAYLDGEFDEDDRVHYAAHLTSCPSCRRVALFEEAFRRQLRSHLDTPTAPPNLRARVCSALASADGSQHWWGRPWARRYLPAAMAVGVAAVVAVFGHNRLLESRLCDLAEASITYHRQRLPLDVRASNPEPIRRYFSDKVPFAVRPLFNNPQAQLVGARLSNLREHQAAYLVYEVGGQRVSVFVIDPRAIDDQPSPRNNGQVFWHDARGYQVALFRSGGTGYAVASDMNRRQLVQLISHTE